MEVSLEYVLDIVGVDGVEVIDTRVWGSEGLERAAIVGDAIVDAVEINGMEDDSP